MSAGGSTKVIVISLLANFGIALSKLAGALFTGSASLMAESVHSFSDCGNQLLLLYGQRAAKRPPSASHPLGYGREGFFWSFVVALLLFSMGGMFSLYEGYHKLHGGGELSHPLVGVAILLVAVVLEGFSCWACYKEVKLQKGRKSLWRWIRHTTHADLLVIMLEDLAALFGLLLALVFLAAAWVTGDSFWDGLGSMLIGVLLILVAAVLAVEVKSLLLGEHAGDGYQQKAAEILEEILPGARLIRFIALQQGVDAVLVACKIAPKDGAMPVSVAMDAINRYEAAVRQRFPEIRWQFVELDHEA